MEKPNSTSSGADVMDGTGGVRALTVSDLGVVFQPLVEVNTGQVFAHEALVRCHHPEYSSPRVLFERAVVEDACGRLGRLIREVAFGTAGDVPLSVNLHPDELSSPWLERADEPLSRHARPVFLEITEAAAFTHFDLCKGPLTELCGRTGALLVVDDFGAGTTSLRRLVDLLPAMVKVDLTLTREIHRRARSRAVVRHLVNLCTELGARVVAEGVESVEELSCVRDLGVHYAQGYLLARPATPPPLVAWPFGARVPLASRAPSAAEEDDGRPLPLPLSPPAPKRPQRPRPSRRAPAPFPGDVGEPNGPVPFGRKTKPPSS
jgi:EAL domain-containing protein (putative c-di-GMP-specific phosphodiesterase class I)